MNPYLRLVRELLLKPALKISGVVIEVLRNDAYTVRTSSGTIEVKSTAGVAYKLGDEVLVSNGVIQGSLKNINSIPTYNV